MNVPVYQMMQMPARKPANAAVALERARRRQAGEPPVVGVIYNPRSHRNKGRDLDSELHPQVYVATPGNRDQLPEALAGFAEQGIDLLIINGGDGTVRDVLTCGYAVFGDDWPAIAVLPKGKTNALTVDFSAPHDWSLQAAIEAFEKGSRIHRRPMVVTRHDEAVPQPSVLGFILGAGVFTKATRSGQTAHSIGAFDGVAVGVTTAWTLLQMFFGGRDNPWRQGTKMSLKLGEARTPMWHSGHGREDRREIFFASTLERFPAGLKPFGKLTHGLKLVALDQPRRRLIAPVLLSLLGKKLRGLRQKGIHQIAVPGFEMDIEDEFILDGEAFSGGRYSVKQGPALEFVAP